MVVAAAVVVVVVVVVSVVVVDVVVAVVVVAIAVVVAIGCCCWCRGCTSGRCYRRLAAAARAVLTRARPGARAKGSALKRRIGGGAALQRAPFIGCCSGTSRMCLEWA